MAEQKGETTPWTIQQTFTGIALTLLPWIALTMFTKTLNVSKPAHPAPLSLQADIGSAIFMVIFSLIVEGAFLIAPLYYANRSVQGDSQHWRLALQALGFRKFNVGQALLLVFLFMIAIYGVDILYQTLITAFHLNLQTNDQVILNNSKVAPISTYATLLAAVIIAPFCEEVFFRSFVMTGFLRVMSPILSIFLSSFLFALAHVDAGSFAVLFIIGLALAYLRFKTQSIWPGLILHFLNNAIGAISIILIMQGITPR